jgi:hypothetical protein
MEEVMFVLTSKSLETMLKRGGSGDWVAADWRVNRCRYLVAVRHGHSGWSEDDIEHDCAFLVGKISGYTRIDGRKIINLEEYAEIHVPNAWPGNRNPVAYLSPEGLLKRGIDVSKLDWKPFPTDQIVPENNSPSLTIEQAKVGIAKTLGIAPDCVEITIRA